jgi:hypothetical protein
MALYVARASPSLCPLQNLYAYPPAPEAARLASGRDVDIDFHAVDLVTRIRYNISA